MFLVQCMNIGEWISACESMACIPKEVANITTFLYNAIRFVAPLVLIIVGMFEMAKCITMGKEDEIRKAQQMLVKRAIAAAIIFLLFSIITWGLDVLDSETTDTKNVISCMNALFNHEAD